MDEARAQAWDFAVRLCDARDDAARTSSIERQGVATVAFAEAVRLGAPVGELLARDTREDVSAKVRLLAQGEVTDGDSSD
jgi:hypothetical protein